MHLKFKYPYYFSTFSSIFLVVLVIKLIAYIHILLIIIEEEYFCDS